MQASIVFPLSDPILVNPIDQESNLDLFHSIYPGSNPCDKILQMIQAAPVEKSPFLATVWISDFPLHPAYLTEFFSKAKIEHNGQIYKVRCPTIREYLAFQKLHYVNLLTASISVFEDHFYWDTTFHEPFDVTSQRFEDQTPATILYEIDYKRDFCGNFLLVLETF